MIRVLKIREQLMLIPVALPITESLNKEISRRGFVINWLFTRYYYRMILILQYFSLIKIKPFQIDHHQNKGT